MPMLPIPPPPPKMPEETISCMYDKKSTPPHCDNSLWAKNTFNAEAEITKLIGLNDLKSAELISYYPIQPILQDGPQCGLVALAMSSQDSSKPVTIAHLLAEARVRGYTQHGEIYSVDYMSTLAAVQLPDHKPEILFDIQSKQEIVKDPLSNGALILIPYDADFNHAPCLKHGHKAHWALLVGLISCRQGFYVLARHGKSRHLGCWALRDLLESNANLEEEGVIRHAGGYIIPKGGVGGPRGLRGRALALHPFS